MQPQYPQDINYYQPGIPQNAPPEYQNIDQIESYGSIIKDLTDTDKLLEDYELRLLGKKKEDNRIVKDHTVTPRIKDEQTAKDFIEIIRSIANQNTHFSGFEEAEIYKSLMALNYTMNRWMMFQREKIPRLYRQKISLEAMNIAKASLMKANKGLILQWSKGNIKEGQNINYNPNERKRGMLDFIFPPRK